MNRKLMKLIKVKHKKMRAFDAFLLNKTKKHIKLNTNDTIFNKTKHDKKITTLHCL